MISLIILDAGFCGQPLIDPVGTGSLCGKVLCGLTKDRIIQPTGIYCVIENSGWLKGKGHLKSFRAFNDLPGGTIDLQVKL